MKTKYTGTLVGLSFSIGSLISILSIFIPIIAIVPGAIIETIAKSILGHKPYSNVGRATLLTYLCLFIISILVFYLKYLKSEKQTDRPLKSLYVKFFIIEFFIIHGLGFYIYWAFKLNYASDGQLIFAVYSSFPYSSALFLVLGFLGDLIVTKERNGT
jgi:hypothetical protein